ncbi:hypothetical protein [Streptomyces sp. NPDC058157]|uniref:hypothetical protein n=1 Tax=Streptomyces sp. NPDC058157 TaxID=3346360 RepID=UPI0036F16A50
MEDQLERDKATTGQGLLRAARDGTLTDEEIRRASSGSRWAVRRETGEVRVSAWFGDADPADQCWSFVLSLPLGPGTTLTTVRDEGAC